MNKKRQVVYNLRQTILQGAGVRDEILSMIDDLVEDTVLSVCSEQQKPIDWDLTQLSERFNFLFNSALSLPSDIELETQRIFDYVREEARKLYISRAEQKEVKLEALTKLASTDSSPIEFHDEIPSYTGMEQRTMLEALDHFWNIHLQDMDDLRDGIDLRGYGQKNPLYEYQREGFVLFQQMLSTMKEAIVRKLSYEDIIDVDTLVAAVEAEQERRAAIEKQMKMIHEPTLIDSERPDEDTDAHKDPDDQRARLEAQKKERRKKRR
jgi:preprotein translocase subunit SecA